jgi:phenylacetate-coenzyme A ligase PaaK-like adenylate-forming protein
VLFATTLPDDLRYHFWPQYGHFELVDGEGRSVTQPGQVGEIVGTSYDNLVMPFVRYRTGDYAVLGGEPDASMPGSPVVQRIEGRLQEFIVCADHRLVTVTTIGAAHLKELEQCLRIQYEQHEPGKLTLRVMPLQPMGPQDKQRVRDAIRHKTQGGCEAEVVEVDNIDLTVRGKQRLLVQHLDVSRYLGAALGAARFSDGSGVTATPAETGAAESRWPMDSAASLRVLGEATGANCPSQPVNQSSSLSEPENSADRELFDGKGPSGVRETSLTQGISQGARALSRFRHKSPPLSSLVAFAKRSDFTNQLVRYAFGGNSSVRRIIVEMERSDAARRKELQSQLVGRVLARARSTEYGRGYGPEISDWPILSKKRLRESPRDFLLKYLPKVQASTSGTSGEPLRIWRGIGNVTAEQCFIDHLSERGGADFRRARIAVMRGDMPRRRRGSEDLISEKLGARRLVLAGALLSEKTAQQYIDRIESFAPDILWVYPTVGDMLAISCSRLGRTLPIKLVLSSSEMLSDAAMERMRAAFGGAIIDFYGQAERVALAVRMTVNEGFFVPAYGKVELHPLDQQGSSKLTSIARIVATGLWNDVMPLVRYDTGDLIEYNSNYGRDELELVEVGVLPFVRIIGRAGQFLRTKSGGFIQALGTIAKDFESVLQVQYIQDEDFSVTAKLLATDRFDTDERRKLESAARRIIPNDIDFRVCVVDRLEVAPSGKTPFVICRAK